LIKYYQGSKLSVSTSAGVDMNLKHYREEAGVTQKQLEDMSGVKQATISKLERGDSLIPTLSVARRIVEGLKRSGIKDITIDKVFPSKTDSAA
jgi:predicted transcriptional regulator